MRVCVRDHGLTKAQKGAAQLLSAALVMAIVAAPIASSWHELTVRHVVCPEHGELTHVSASQSLRLGGVPDSSSIEGQRVETTEGHDHCSLGFVVRSRALLSIVRSAARTTPPPIATRAIPDAATPPGRAFVLASAPKTSPPII
jgi:hypothetical protein